MSDMGHIQTATLHIAPESADHRRAVRLAALRNLTGPDGRDLDVAVALGLTDEEGAVLLRRALTPAATPPDPAGCAACGRASRGGCAVCRRAVAE